MNDTQRGLILLLKSAVTGIKETLPDGFCLEDALDIIKKQHLVTLAYQGALNCGICNDTPLMQQLLKAHYRLLIKSERQMQAIDSIFKAFDENSIDYMPLKGCNMKKLYPSPELRLMGDADILIRDEQYDKIDTVMRSIGFSFKREFDNVYEWDSDSLHVELHKSLMPEGDEDYGEYYGSGWEFAVKGEGSRYDLSLEDTFVFIFTHFTKHYRVAGIGCRHVLDIYVYLNSVSGLDESYIRQELEKLDLLEFYLNMLKLLDNWFADGEADEITELITAYIFSSGSWGSAETAMYSNELRRAAGKGKQLSHSKFKSVVYTIFTPLSAMKNMFPILRKVPILLPIFWVVRWFDVLINRPHMIKVKSKVWRKLNDEAVASRRKALSLVGLRFKSTDSPH